MSYDTASEDAFGIEHDIFTHIFVSTFLSDCTEHRRLGFFWVYLSFNPWVNYMMLVSI